MKRFEEVVYRLRRWQNLLQAKKFSHSEVVLLGMKFFRSRVTF